MSFIGVEDRISRRWEKKSLMPIRGAYSLLYYPRGKQKIDKQAAKQKIVMWALVIKNRHSGLNGINNSICLSEDE